ncbi:MAG: hypothetical protein Q8L60_00440 [Gammaproteobacteria bacterium]|nr:hypothetical protein [Gammaproteobacteria bacterium]MDP2142327.1 hypothetical protein [Gammaproteobacteria bacterium]MDP2348568.1 hypothetical protein [Gammaproteobacteria bacterium]
MQESHDSANTTAPSARQLIVGTSAALAVALVVLFTIVLPAEFGIDPLGTGRALGLLELADASQGPLEKLPVAHKRDYVEFILEPFQSVEYKYHLQADSSMVYSWQATGELVYDMHADPEGMEGEEFVESFDQGADSSGFGTYHAPFTGIHGWFWENRTFEVVVLRLHSSGFYENSIVFRDGGSYEQVLRPLFE